MGVEARIIRLERAQPQPRENCPKCGAPDAIVMRVIHTDHDRPLPKCPSCGRTVTDDGRPVGSPYKRIIRGERGPDFVPHTLKPMP